MILNKKSFATIKFLSLSILTLALNFSVNAQHLTNKEAWDKLIAIENDSINHKLERILDLKKRFEDLHLTKDSVYARILHKAGVYQYYDAKQLNLAIANTREAISINLSGNPASCKKFSINSYKNLGIFYNELLLSDKALLCFDSSILLAQAYPDLQQTIIESHVDKCNILFKKGDYEKYNEEATIGEMLAQKNLDTFHVVIFLNHNAQAGFFQGNLNAALKDAEKALQLASRINDFFEEASSLKIKARVYIQQQNFQFANSLFQQSIETRIKTGDYKQIADDYTDFGNFFLNAQHNYAKAQECYHKTSEYADKANDKERLAKARVNTGLVYFYQHNYKAAEQYYLKAFDDLQLGTKGNFLSNPPSARLNTIGNKDLLLVILNNKTELLLNLYKQTNEKKYLDGCLQTALITDSVVTQTRYDQSGEQSKLYWRNRTREFFTNAMEASYLAKEPVVAFYFMEKSRAVLLNDKLNEIGASVLLPVTEANKEQSLHISISEEQQKLDALNDSPEEYKNQLVKLLQTKAEFEHYIKSLEQKYPAYYQYKYDDKIPSLDSLQRYLLVNNQSFIHYFINDTVAYILSITPVSTKFIKLSKTDFNSNQLLRFLKFCSNKDSLNNNYTSFISLSNSIYKLLFQPLQIPKGRVIICPDNFLIPFEALCIDNTGNNFLINNYAFSYVYSARYLMKKFNTNNKAKGNFIGFAPVTFQSYPGVPELAQSASSLKKCASYYSNTELFTNSKATRSNFLNSIAGYNIVNIFSHASADTTGNEPVLFMHDSIIKLSELQMLQNKVSSLVILSACETDVGKNAVGEGIYSLARGFSAAGIPSVAATLWTADERAIYAVSEKFHEYLSQGMRKDEALQKAKIYFMQNNSKGKLLPYYWANMIIAGNTDPVILSGNISSYSNTWWWVAGGIIFVLVALIFKRIFFKKTEQKLQV